MSEVTNIIIHTFGDIDTEKANSIFNKYIEDKQGYKPGFVSFDYEKNPEKPYDGNPWYGGSKYLEAQLFCGAINYLDLDDFISYLKSKEWPDYAIIQLMVKEQNDELFRVIDVIKKWTD